MCCVEWFAGTLGRSSGGLALEIFCNAAFGGVPSYKKFQSPAYHVATSHFGGVVKHERLNGLFSRMRKKLLGERDRGNFLGTSSGGTFVVRLKRLLKFLIPIGDTERTRKLVNCPSAARLSGHQKFSTANWHA